MLSVLFLIMHWSIGSCFRFIAVSLRVFSLVLAAPVIYHSLCHVSVWLIPHESLVFFNAVHVTTFPSHGGQKCSLTEPDWSATAQPAGQTLVSHTRPLCLFLTAFLCIQSLLPFSPHPLPFFHFFSPSLHLHILYLPLIICLTNPSILFSPSSVMKRTSTAGGLTQYKLFPSKHCGRMTHYLWKNSSSLLKPLWCPETQCGRID